jgi:hypothetical protein
MMPASRTLGKIPAKIRLARVLLDMTVPERGPGRVQSMRNAR